MSHNGKHLEGSPWHEGMTGFWNVSGNWALPHESVRFGRVTQNSGKGSSLSLLQKGSIVCMRVFTRPFFLSRYRLNFPIQRLQSLATTVGLFISGLRKVCATL